MRLVLQRVVDISTPENWAKLQTDADELTGSWRELQAAGQMAPTQQLGTAARALGLEAIKARAATDGKTNLAVFPDNLLKGSFVEVYDPHEQLRGRLEGHK